VSGPLGERGVLALGKGRELGTDRWQGGLPETGAQKLGGWVAEQPANLHLPLATPGRLQGDPTAGEVDHLERLSVVTEPRPHGQGCN
jgi:hypothetical protein